MTTDAGGHYSFVVVEPGRYDVEAAVEGVAFSSARGLSIAGGVRIEGQDLVAGTAALEGRVEVASAGTPLGSARVLVERADGGHALTGVATLLTDPNGAFSLSGLIPGTYRVVAAASGHATGQQLVEVGAGAPASVTLGLGPEVRLRLQTMQPPSAARISSGTAPAPSSAGSCSHVQCA